MTRKNLRADEYGVGGEAGVEAVLQLAAAFDHKKPLPAPLPGFLLKRQQLFDLRVLTRCYELVIHQRFA